MSSKRRSVRIELNRDYNIAAIEAFVAGKCEEIAKEIAEEAQRSTAFQDYKGTAREKGFGGAVALALVATALGINLGKAKATTSLRGSIKAFPSKYTDGGWIVGAWAPHAHLVEFGHDQIDWRSGRKVGEVQARPFLRPAAEKVFRRFAARMAGSLRFEWDGR